VQIQLRGDPELRVLWLSDGRQELALSAEGIWLRTGRREADLPWDDIDQVQLQPIGRRGRTAKVEVFRGDGTAYAVGPYPAPVAERWVRACVQAAREAGQGPLPLDGGFGCALPHRGTTLAPPA
jgi:hypothetical protein